MNDFKDLRYILTKKIYLLNKMSKDAKIHELEEKIQKLERGTSKAFKNVQDYQAGIGRSALSFQRIQVYIISFLLVVFGIAILIYAVTSLKNKDNKETDYIIGGVCLAVAVVNIFIFRWYSGLVKRNKKAQIFNAFLVESQIFSRR